MKKVLLTICLVGLFVSVQGCNNVAHKDRFFSIGGGNGGKTDSGSFTLEGGEITDNGPESNTLLTAGFTCIFNGGDASYDESTSGDYSSLYEWERSIGTLRDTGAYRDWPEFGFLLKYGFEVIPDTDFYVTALGGVTFSNEVQVWESTINVYPYSYGETSWTAYGLFGGGITYFVNEKFSLQVDCDNRRGTTLGLGWKY